MKHPIEHNAVTLKPSEMEFNDFNSFVRKAFNDHSHYCEEYLLRHRQRSPNTFQTFKTEIVNHSKPGYTHPFASFKSLEILRLVALVVG